MRACSAFVPLLVLVSVGCGQDALMHPPGREPTGSPVVTDPPLSGRVRLTTSLSEGYDGYRFTDRAVLTTRLLWSGGVSVPEVRGSDGTVLTGDAQRTDLQFRAGRYTGLSAPGDSVCLLPGPFASIEAVDGTKCSQWSHTQVLNVVGNFTENKVGTGLVVRIESSAFRLWVAETGWDLTQQKNFVLLDYIADARFAAPAGTAPGTSQCAKEHQFCQVRDDCCNSRHSCYSGVCEY